MAKQLNKKLDRIIKLDAFQFVFDELKEKDEKKTMKIEHALKSLLKENHEAIKKTANNAELKYLLYKESVEVKNQSKGYKSITEMMGNKRNALYMFSIELTEGFFNYIFIELDKYFHEQKKVIFEELENNAEWYRDLWDTGKKMGELLNIGKKWLVEGLEKLDVEHEIDDSDVVDTKSLLEKTLEKHLPFIQKSTVNKKNKETNEIVKILNAASKEYQDNWEKELKEQAPKADLLKSVFGQEFTVNIKSELSTAEKTLINGLGGAVVGTLGLAAGWHTLTYAMLSVFPPIAFFAVVGTVAVAVFTKDKALEKRKKSVDEIVNQYRRYFIFQLEIDKVISKYDLCKLEKDFFKGQATPKYKFDEVKNIGNKTVREELLEQNKEIINMAIEEWTRAISGNLTNDDYQNLDAAFTKHLILINQCIEMLDE